MILTIDIGAIVAVLILLVALYLRSRTLGQLLQAKEALARSQEQMDLALRAAGVALWSWDIVRDAVTAGETSSIQFGLRPGEFPQTVAGFAALVHPEDRARVEQEVSNSVEHGADYSTEFRVVWPDGTVRFLSTRGKVYRDPQGKPLRLTGISWDVTERKQAEENLRALNQQQTQSLRELERRNQESAMLSEMADLLQACGDSAEAYDIVVQFCRQLFAGCAGALYIFSASRNQVSIVASWNDPALPEPIFAPDDCWALRRGHPQFVDPGRFSTPCRHLKDIRKAGHACIPMMAQGTGLGILYLQSLNHDPAERNEGPQFLTVAERQLASTVAEQVGLSLANLSLQDALRLQAIRDSLTGLYNRRYLDESLDREMARVARNNRAVALVMVDIDHFKRFNDSFGHEAGDALLRAFGQLLRDRRRKSDIACRYGGEEFCLVFVESPLEGAMQRAEQIRQDTKQLTVQHGGHYLGPITISMGIACYPAHGNTAADLIAAADAALYRAKSEGRDRVVVAETTSPAVAPPV